MRLNTRQLLIYAKRIGLMLGSVLCAGAVMGEAPRSSASEVALDRFLVLPKVREVKLSPAGDRLVVLLREERSSSVWLHDIEGGEATRLLDSRLVESLFWASDGEGIFIETTDRLAHLPIPQKLPTSTAERQRVRWIFELDDTREQVFLGIDSRMPRSVLVAEKASEGQHRLLRVDADGTVKTLFENEQQIHSFLLGNNGEVRYLKRADGLEQVLVRIDDGESREILRCDALDSCRPVAYQELGTARGERLWIVGRDGGDLFHLYTVDVVPRDSGGFAVGPGQLRHRDPKGIADLRTVRLDPQTGLPLLAVYDSDQRRGFGIAEVEKLLADRSSEMESKMARLRSLLPTARLEVSARQQARHWLVIESGSRIQHSRHHVYDTVTGSLREILSAERISNDPLPESMLVEPEAVTYQASDGLELHGLLYLPQNAAPGAPMVVRVHGGPWNHVRRSWSLISQFLVSRGYIVFVPNFRSSTGFGRRYIEAAGGDFGDGRVQQDILEGIDFLHAEGIGNANKVAIIGHSFGGFSTLGALAFTPKRFVAGIASAPPIDLVRALQDFPDDALQANGLVRKDVIGQLVGNLDDPQAMAELRRQSPEHRLASTERPLLVMAGGVDEKVDIVDVTHYVSALNALDKDVSFLVDEEQGHSFENDVSLGSYLFLAERFLAHHLGGYVVAPEDPRLELYVKKHLRLVGPSLAESLSRPSHQLSATDSQPPAVTASKADSAPQEALTTPER